MPLISQSNTADQISVGTTAQRPASAAIGALRYGTNSLHPEMFTGPTGWKLIAYVGSPSAPPKDLTLSGNVSANVQYYVNNLTISSGASLTPVSGITHFFCTGDVNIGSNVKFNYGKCGVPGSGGAAANTFEIQNAFGCGVCPGTSALGVKTPAAAMECYSSSSGASGGKNQGGQTSSNSVGGSGGGSIVISSLGNINVGGGCVFNADGESGKAAAGFATKGGGAGGGSGGFIVLQAHGDLIVASGTTMSVNGGPGFNGIGASSGGGGGGAGGYIILGCYGGTFSAAVTSSATGGPPGSRVPGRPGGKRGGGGAGCGGRGGNLNTGYDGTTGQDGQVLLDFLII